MTVTEKVAYLKGLAEGLGIEEDSKEGKLLKAVMDVLADLAVSVEDLDALENDFYDDECDCCGDEDEEAYYDVCCPNCNEEFCVDEETLLEGGIECPGCGEHLDFGDIECDDECGCGCHDHDHTDE